MLWSGVTFLFLCVVLAVHIYLVTRPKAPTASTRVMARIDIKQPVNSQDSAKIVAWMYHQPGVDRVLVNPVSARVIFTFAPVITKGDKVVSNFISELGFTAVRYIPTAEELKSGCPVASTSPTYKIYKFFKQIF